MQSTPCLEDTAEVNYGPKKRCLFCIRTGHSYGFSPFRTPFATKGWLSISLTAACSRTKWTANCFWSLQSLYAEGKGRRRSNACQNSYSIPNGFCPPHNQQHLLMLWPQGYAVGRPHSVCFLKELNNILLFQATVSDYPASSIHQSLHTPCSSRLWNSSRSSGHK